MTITGKKLKWTDCAPIEFVRRWEALAQGPGAQLYERHPGTASLTKADLNRLYAFWQNRSRLTQADRKMLLRLVRVLPSLNAFRGLASPKEHEVLNFYDDLTREGGVRFSLKLFAFHVALPYVFPPLTPTRLATYDLVTHGKPQKRPGFTEVLLPTYFTYQKWFFELVTAAAADPARVDRAILAVGQCLDRYGPVMAA